MSDETFSYYNCSPRQKKCTFDSSDQRSILRSFFGQPITASLTRQKTAFGRYC